MTRNFQDDLLLTQGVLQGTDMEILKAMIPGCETVNIVSEAADRNGVDYVATLRKGARIFIDAKNRVLPGISKYWKLTPDGKRKEPEVALEKWSVIPGGKYKKRVGKVGWTLCETKQTDMILYTFPREDCPTSFLVSFQHLRTAFIANFDKWWAPPFRVAKQDNQNKKTGEHWESEMVFVPVGIVFDAMRKISQGNVLKPNLNLKSHLQLNLPF